MQAAWAVEHGAAEAVMKMSFGNPSALCTIPRRAPPGGAPIPAVIVAELTEEVNLPCAKRIGVTTAEPAITIGSDSASIDELLALNEGVLEDVYPNRTPAGRRARARAGGPRLHPRRPQERAGRSPRC